MQRHIRGECLDIHKVYIVGRQILESDRTVFLTFANGWMLLNMFRSIASGSATQLFRDVTSKTSTAALNKLDFGVNILGAHFAPWTYSLIPAECKSAAAYVGAYR